MSDSDVDEQDYVDPDDPTVEIVESIGVHQEPFDSKLYELVDAIEYDDPAWTSTSIRLPNPIDQVIGTMVDETHVGVYRVVSAAVIYGHQEFQSEFENQLYELKDLYNRAANHSKFASSFFSSRQRSNHYETPMDNQSLSGPRTYYIPIKEKGLMEKHARWVGFKNSMFVRHMVALAILRSEFGKDSIWRSLIEDYKMGLDEYLKNWWVPMVIKMGD